MFYASDLCFQILQPAAPISPLHPPVKIRWGIKMRYFRDLLVHSLILVVCVYVACLCVWLCVLCDANPAWTENTVTKCMWRRLGLCYATLSIQINTQANASCLWDLLGLIKMEVRLQYMVLEKMVGSDPECHGGISHFFRLQIPSIYKHVVHFFLQLCIGQQQTFSYVKKGLKASF